MEASDKRLYRFLEKAITPEEKEIIRKIIREVEGETKESPQGVVLEASPVATLTDLFAIEIISSLVRVDRAEFGGNDPKYDITLAEEAYRIARVAVEHRTKTLFPPPEEVEAPVVVDVEPVVELDPGPMLEVIPEPERIQPPPEHLPEGGETLLEDGVNP